MSAVTHSKLIAMNLVLFLLLVSWSIRLAMLSAAALVLEATQSAKCLHLASCMLYGDRNLLLPNLRGIPNCTRSPAMLLDGVFMISAIVLGGAMLELSSVFAVNV